MICIFQQSKINHSRTEQEGQELKDHSTRLKGKAQQKPVSISVNICSSCMGQALLECKPVRKAIGFVGLVNAVLEHDCEKLVAAELVAAVVDAASSSTKPGQNTFWKCSQNASAALAATELAPLLGRDCQCQRSAAADLW